MTQELRDGRETQGPGGGTGPNASMPSLGIWQLNIFAYQEDAEITVLFRWQYPYRDLFR